MLDVILALHVAGALDAAAEAQGALRRCLHDSGLEIAIVHGPLGGVWTLAEEIGALPRNFPQPLRVAFASSTRSGDLTSAFLDACRAIERDRAEVARWAADVAVPAPNVAGILRNALAQQRATSVNRTGFQVWRLSYLLIPLLLSLGRVCTSSNHYQYSAPIVTTSEQAYLPPQIQEPIIDRGLVARAAGRGAQNLLLADAIDQLCGATGPRHGQLVCADIEALAAALDTGACDEVASRTSAIKRALRGKGAQELEVRFLSRLTLATWKTCGGQRAVDDEGDNR
jgi:hypothetical protein